MNRGEFVEQLIEKKANGQKNVMFELCDNTDCNFRCPYSTADLCDNALVDDLLDRIIVIERELKLHKQTYKVTRFEYDLLSSYVYAYGGICLCEYSELEYMVDVGYLKGIPMGVPVDEILENVEVIDSE